MRTREEVETEISDLEAKVSLLHEERDAIILATSRFSIGQIITFGKSKTEGKVVRLRIANEAMPVVVLKKASGEWGFREKTLYSWDLEQ